MSDSVRFLMCAPDYFDVQYVINPWMEGNVHKASPQTVAEQWQKLFRLLKDQGVVEQVAPQVGLPDMVFTANAGLVVGQQVVLSRFLHRERKGEEPFFRTWFAEHGFTVHELPDDLPFEGAGDALLHRDGRTLWAGYGFRSELDSHPFLAETLDLDVVSLRLVDKRFYHLDTCFCPLERGYLLYYPAAFDAHSNRLIEQRVPASKRLAVGEADAVNFACNAVNVGRRIVLNQASADLKSRLQSAGFNIIETPLSEFMKSGGGAKCLTLRLTEPVPKKARAAVAVESRIVRLEGHLLDSGMLSKALDVAVDAGGSFQILKFDLGAQRQSTSSAEIKISAPSAQTLGKIMSQLIDRGAIMTSPAAADVHLAEVTQPGVAPDDFYVTTIYPTEVSVKGLWVRVARQRMDGVVVVETGNVEPAATCRLIRDLKTGERVVVAVEGIRTVRKPAGRDERGESGGGAHEFSFMGAGVSSERRVELVVDQIAWDLRRIREQGGKVVVVAGPVVVHTGAGEHLAHLLGEGYVQALLGGNAIAVHDLEQALLGTSLGIDLKRGVPVQGGHRHHLNAINMVRRCGSIAQAVEQGVLTSGIFYECIRRQIPFSLAGSIRDDGPLPDTEMDLVRAQADYARLLEGADMILMLSSMLHSIGVGNMTPAGIKLVCVDINPAVVTKLSDRGSLESIGVVTDVGLFLSLLVQQLKKLQGAVLTSDEH